MLSRLQRRVSAVVETRAVIIIVSQCVVGLLSFAVAFDLWLSGLGTANGRVVKGGGGIAPDVEVSPRPIRDLERSLLQQGYFYSFASDWLARHRGMPEQQQMMMTQNQDQAYREFVA